MRKKSAFAETMTLTHSIGAYGLNLSFDLSYDIYFMSKMEIWPKIG